MSVRKSCRRQWLLLVICVFVAGKSVGQETRSVLRSEDHVHLHHALRCLDMSETDFGFARDHAEPRLVFDRARETLRTPLRLPEMADEILQAASASGNEQIWSLVEGLYEVSSEIERVVPDALSMKKLSPALKQALAVFTGTAAKAHVFVERAFVDITPEEQAYATASCLGGVFNAEDREEVRGDMFALGLSRDLIEQVIEEGWALDPEPSATRYLDIIAKLDQSSLLSAGRVMQMAAVQLRDAALEVEQWPARPVSIATPYGPIQIGTTESEFYSDPALLILDPGGADTYAGSAGRANGLQSARLAVVVDLKGADRYGGRGMVGAGTALWGVNVLLDNSGDDFYQADYTGQAAGIFGVAWLEDMAGDDIYRGHAMAQGAGYVGIGILRDRTGNDTYEVGFYGQAFAGIQGVGLLIDAAGVDRYLSGGREPDYERHPQRYLSLAQGFAIGMRPFGGGGIAALVDLEGNDVYEADIYGQGVSYWYSVGMLLDVAGNDTYSMYHYGQGSGIHMSSGLLFDGQGDDFYSGYILSQGNAHDYAVGMLFDREGDDTYTADHHSQGRAMNNALALFVDSQGDDAYFCRQPDKCQGIGNDGGHREYGSLALMLDLAGRDQYSCGAEDGARLIRPDFGIVYDLKDEGVTHEKE